MRIVKVRRIFHGAFHDGNIDQARETFIMELKTLLGPNFQESEFKEDEHKFAYEDRFILKSKIKKEIEGEVQFRSNDYIMTYWEGGRMHTSYGPSLSEATLTDNGWTIEAAGGYIEYIILSK